MKRIILALALVAGITLAPTAPTHAAPAPKIVATSFTACDGSSAYLGNRVCIDHTTGFGPVAYVFTSGTTLSQTFGLCESNPAPSGVATMYEWVYSGGGASQAAGWPGAAGGTVYTDSSNGFPGLSVEGTCGNVANANVLAFYANSANYELVIAN